MCALLTGGTVKEHVKLIEEFNFTQNVSGVFLVLVFMAGLTRSRVQLRRGIKRV